MPQLARNGRLDPGRLTTHKFPFDQVDWAVEMTDKKLDGFIKPLILYWLVPIIPVPRARQ